MASSVCCRSWAAGWPDGIESGAPDYVAWFGQREQYRAAWRAFFREWDVLLMPTFLTPAYPHWDKPWPNTPESIKKTLDVNGKPVIEELGLFCASVATLAGQPSTAFPAGRSPGGLPIGLQAIGPYLEDRTPIRFASLVGRELIVSLQPESRVAAIHGTLEAREQYYCNFGVNPEKVAELQRGELRVTGADVPMPYNKHLERAAKADPAKVVAAVKKVLYLA